MPIRPTHYPNVHDEFYSPAGLTRREAKPMRQVGYDMGLRGRRVTREFLDDQAQVYHGRLNAALHTIDQRADIVQKRAFDIPRNTSLIVLAVGGLVILGLALTVDFKILHDFWTMVYQNKFLQVPESLKDNVIFKSLQVLFAVIAIHFLMSAPGIFGKAIRGVFVVAIGVMVIGMLIGLGFLAAKSTLPAGSTFNGRPINADDSAPTVSNDEILRGLGLRPSSGASGISAMTAPMAPSDSGAKSKSKSHPKGSYGIASKLGRLGQIFEQAMKDPESTGTVVFFGTFSLIFLFVSSVGALCLHYSLRSFNALFGGVSPEYSEHAMPSGLHGVYYWALGKGEWRPRTRKDLADQRQRILHAQRLIGDPGYREGLMQRFFSDFSAGYMEGLHDRDASPRRFAGPDFETLRNEMRTELSEARADWSAAELEERLPSVDLRQSLGYNPRHASGSPFGYISNLMTGRRRFKDGGVLEDTRAADERSLPSPDRDNQMRGPSIAPPSDGEAA
jgi:hypothetical protein